MTKPRNPRYFPRMKVRGARRRQLAAWQRMGAALDDMRAALGALGNGAKRANQASALFIAAMKAKR